MPDEHLLELLIDLRHDLGKHVLLPVAMLPAHATEAQVREGLRRGLLETRPSGKGHRSARDLWDGFCRDAPPLPTDIRAPLEAAVVRALAWQASLGDDPDEPLARDVLLADLRGVGEAISMAITTLRRAG